MDIREPLSMMLIDVFKVLEMLIKIPATFLPIIFISVDDIIHNAAVVYAIIFAYKCLINSNDSMQ